VPERGSPNLARRQRLAAELRRLRERAGLTGNEATARLGWSASSKLSRIELSKSGVKSADLQSLLDLYEVTPARREELTALAEESRTSGAIQAVSMRLPGEQVAFLEAEADAESIWIWEPQVVPGLLQTEDYARVLLQAWVTRFALPSAEVDRRIETRRLRQEVLTSDSPPRVSAVIDESVLHRRVGERSIMRAQLEHLAEISELPNVDIRILPFNGEHLIPTGSFNYLRFRQVHEVLLNDLVAFDHLTGMENIEGGSEVHQYSVVLGYLIESALDPEGSRALIISIADEIWADLT
jgi:transcriptional regulator with XRE-family HTH domain